MVSLESSNQRITSTRRTIIRKFQLSTQNKFGDKMHSSQEVSFIQERKYQQYILQVLKKLHDSNMRPPVLVELDCGLGKRILSYLMVKECFPDKKPLILQQSTSSLLETKHYFENKYNMRDVGTIGSRTPPYLREKILRDYRVILATPQTLANVLKKHPQDDFGIELILVNEIDKIIRRTATRRTLVYPYPQIIQQLKNAWIIGLSGTLRDSHLIVTSRVKMQRELQTLAENLPDVRIITMEEIMASDHNFSDHVSETTIEGIPIEDSPIQKLLQYLDDRIKELRNQIITMAREEGLIHDSQKNLALIAGQLPVDQELRDEHNTLLMLRKYVTAMVPSKFKTYLNRIPSLPKELIRDIPIKSTKVQVTAKLLKNHRKKAIVMVSYIHTGKILQKYLKKAEFEVYFISGQVNDKNEVINQFKSSQNSNAVLIMTQVGERDLDIPEADLIIAFDTINTTKTMYQKFKRTRGGKVSCLYYKDTSEELKVKRLFKNLNENYPWSIRLDEKNKSMP